MLKATLTISDEAVSVSYTDADVVNISVTQGASLWEADGADKIKPKGGKTVGADYLDLSGKVDKVAGKGLSTNDFTDALETKLTDLPTNAALEITLTALNDGKVDKVVGKELSDNNYTDAEVTKVGYISGSGDGSKALSDSGVYRKFTYDTGFTNNQNISVSYDSTTRKITLTGTFEAFYQGVKVTALTDGWVSDAHADVAGTYYLSYNGSFVFNTTPWSFYDLQIAYVVYDGVKFGIREVHGFMQPEAHEEAHRVLGAYKISGADMSGYTLSSTTAAERRPLIAETIIADEDLKTTLPALSTETYSIRYLTGASTRTFSVDQADIIPLDGNQPYYNQFTGGAWQQTLMTNNNYAAIFVAAIPVTSDTASQKLRYVFVQPQTQSATLSTIQGLVPSSLVLGDMLASEYVFTHKIIIRYTAANWSLTSVESLSGTKVQQVSVPPAPTVASNVTFTPAGNIAATNVQTALEELDTEKLSTTGSADNLTFTDTNSHFTTDEVGEGLVQLGVEVDALEVKERRKVTIPATQITAGAGTPSLSKYSGSSAYLNYWSMSGTTTGQSLTALVGDFGSAYDGVEISALIIAPYGSPSASSYEVFQPRVNSITFGSGIDTSSVLSEMVINKTKSPGVVNKVVLDSLCRINTEKPFAIQVYRKNDDSADTWTDPSGVAAIEVRPIKTETPITVTTATGYNSWPFITDINGTMVCIYCVGTAHAIPDSSRAIYRKKSTDGGITWSTATEIINTPNVDDVIKGKGKDSSGNILLWVWRSGTGTHHLYKSTDGDTFSLIANPSFSNVPNHIGDIISVPTVGLMAFYNIGDYADNNTKSWGVVTSADDGVTWSQTQIEGSLGLTAWPSEISAAYIGSGKILAIGRSSVPEATKTTARAMFQLQSTDYGVTWSRALTNITDCLFSTPSIIYTQADDSVELYYYHRVSGILRKRQTTSATIWGYPLLWPGASALAVGSTSYEDAGNVNSHALNGTNITVYYSGDATNTGIYAIRD